MLEQITEGFKMDTKIINTGVEDSELKEGTEEEKSEEIKKAAPVKKFAKLYKVYPI